MTSLRLLNVIAAAALGVLACSSESSSTSTSASSTSSNADSGPTVTCASDPRVDTYVANLTKASTSGQMKVTLVASDPAPPVKGTNVWTVKVTDAAGNPMPGDLTIAPFMPDHGHPSPTKPDVAPQPDGTIKISSLYLFMGGVWRITITSGTESVAFFFCVAG
jgi:hypothetical protein